MTDITTTIAEYSASMALVRRRIDELNQRISSASIHEEGDSRKILETRRYMLYSELWEMEGAMDALQEYLDATAPPPHLPFAQ